MTKGIVSKHLNPDFSLLDFPDSASLIRDYRIGVIVTPRLRSTGSHQGDHRAVRMITSQHHSPDFSPLGFVRGDRHAVRPDFSPLASCGVIVTRCARSHITISQHHNINTPTPQRLHAVVHYVQ